MRKSTIPLTKGFSGPIITNSIFSLLKKLYKSKHHCPNTDLISKYGLYLPTGYNLNKKKYNNLYVL